MDKTKAKVEDYLEYWILALGLETKWDISIEYGEIDGAYAETKPHHQYDTAKMKFNLAKLKDETDSFIERTVIHELLHILDRDRDALVSQIESHLSPDTFKLYENVVEQSTENFIDRLATILYNVKGESIDLRGDRKQRNTTSGSRPDDGIKPPPRRPRVGSS